MRLLSPPITVARSTSIVPLAKLRVTPPFEISAESTVDNALRRSALIVTAMSLLPPESAPRTSLTTPVIDVRSVEDSPFTVVLTPSRLVLTDDTIVPTSGVERFMLAVATL